LSIKIYNIIPPLISTGSTYLFTTDSGIEYEVRFGREKQSLLSAIIAFGVLNDEFEGDEYVETNKGEIFRVMATVIEIIELYIKEHPNTRTFKFTAMTRSDEDDALTSKRMRLYSRYVEYFNYLGWNVDISKNNVLMSRTRS